MGGVAQLGRAMGYRIEGSDAGAYPPMSDQLDAAGIKVHTPYAAEHLDPAPDLTVVGNALVRGNPAVEHLLDAGLAMTSGPAWLAEHVLAGRQVLAVAGTHGKTTTASMLAWILEYAGNQPGFLIGGVPNDFGVSARLGDTGGARAAPFVVEADEYDSAFFDKRSKFVHYRPRVLTINNIEFDHADIFDSLADIRRQFHHVVRTVPRQGLIVAPAFGKGDNGEVQKVLDMGCWTPVASFGEDCGDWQLKLNAPDGTSFEVRYQGRRRGEVRWNLIGRHNCLNAIVATAAAVYAGVDAQTACSALSCFKGVKRRLEVRGRVRGVTVYDDFAHHPTAISATLSALRARVADARILAIVDPASNTMRTRIHEPAIAASLSPADAVWLYAPAALEWDLDNVQRSLNAPLHVESDIDALIHTCASQARGGRSHLNHEQRWIRRGARQVAGAARGRFAGLAGFAVGLARSVGWQFGLSTRDCT